MTILIELSGLYILQDGAPQEKGGRLSPSRREGWVTCSEPWARKAEGHNIQLGAAGVVPMSVEESPALRI